jgi:hypothetical protein
MKFSTNKKGNALVDLIIGIVILGLVSISVVGGIYVTYFHGYKRV